MGRGQGAQIGQPAGLGSRVEMAKEGIWRGKGKICSPRSEQDYRNKKLWVSKSTLVFVQNGTINKSFIGTHSYLCVYILLMATFGL